MMGLPLPKEAGNKVVEKLCESLEWIPHRKAWLDAYEGYRSAKGDPWTLNPIKFDDATRARLRGLYDSRGQSGAIARLRETHVPSCPTCGSQATGTLDHYLPRKEFPEFSIMLENLVPACAHCNSSSKGVTFKGGAAPERFTHPYFDAWLDQPVWRVRFKPPFEAVVFEPVPEPSLGASERTTMRFHLDNVLGRQWEFFCRTTWSAAPGRLRIRCEAQLDEASVRTSIGVWLKEEIITSGPNSWPAAFLRGVDGEEASRDYLVARTLSGSPA